MSDGDGKRVFTWPRLAPRVAPAMLVALGLGLWVALILLRTDTWVSERTTETTLTHPAAPSGEPQVTGTKRTTKETTPPDALLLGLFAGGVVLILAGMFYSRDQDIEGFGVTLRIRDPLAPQVAETSAATGRAAAPPAAVGAGLSTLLSEPSIARARLAEARVLLSGPRTVRIAILSTAVDEALLRHPDVVARVETPYQAAASQTPQVIGTTQVALIAAAAPSAQILPIVVFTDRLSTDGETILRGLNAALDWRAEIVLMDFGTGDPSTLSRDPVAAGGDALRRALSSPGTTFIAPAGNEADDRPSWPARERSVVGVAATDEHGSLAPFSSRGVALAAPGVAIAGVETAHGDELALQTMSGTTFAAGVAAAAAAQVASAMSAPSAGAVRRALEASGAEVPDAAGIHELDAVAAVESVMP